MTTGGDQILKQLSIIKQNTTDFFKNEIFLLT